MNIEHDYNEYEEMPIAHRMAMIDSWNEEYRKTLADIRERNEALKTALRKMEEAP